MKHFICLIGLLLIVSCKSQQSGPAQAAIENTHLSETASSIINDFLAQELQNSRYNAYRDYHRVAIRESIVQSKSLSDYAFNYEYKNSWGKFINEWVLDSIQIQKLQSTLKVEAPFHWRAEDFKSVAVRILESAEIRNSIRTGNYLRKTLVIHLSKPLMIDKNNALLSYDILNCEWVCRGISHSTVLMRKVGEKWAPHSYYEDGVFD